MLLPASGEINGYLSLEYIQGQGQHEFQLGTFRNAQIGIILSGEISAKVDYAAEVRTNQYKIELEESWIRFKPSEAFSLRIGLYLVPFGRYNQFNRPHQTMLILPPLNVEETYPSRWKDLGILADGKMGPFFYSAYLGNGLAEKESLAEGQQFEDNNKDKAKGLRVGIFLSQQLAVGYSYYKGKYDNPGARDLKMQGLDLTWVTKDFQVVGEYSQAKLENPEFYSSGKVEGYFVQVLLDMGRFRPLFSYQRLEYKDSFHGRGFVEPIYPGGGISENKNRWILGFVYYFQPSFFIKFEYDFNREKQVELKNDALVIQAVLSF